MNGSIGPDEAASSLAQARRHQARVIDAVMMPLWYWWVVAAAMIAIGAAVDIRRPVVLAVIIPVAVAVLAGLTGAMIFGAYRRARVRGRDLLGPVGAISIVGFVWLIIAVTLGIGFALRAAGTTAPATIATFIGGLLMVAGGPVLARRLRLIMMANRAGADR